MGRIRILDTWRTVAIVCMLTYHFLYDLALFGMMTWEQFFSPGLNALQLFICCSFIFLAGASARFSRNNLRHGLVVLGAALVVELGAAVVGQVIRFGVLMLLGCSMVIYHFAGRFLQKIPGWTLAVLSAALYFATDGVTAAVTVSCRWLYPLGFLYPGFSSADYFPLLPWLFLFLMGTAFGGWCLKHRDHALLSVQVPKLLTWPGQHSLIIYVLHQPVLYGLTLLLTYIR